MPLSNNQKPAEDQEAKDAASEIKELLGKFKSSRQVFPADKKPKGWSRLSNAPYYRERFALEFKAVLDMMLKEFEAGQYNDVEYKYEIFCQQGGLSRNSLYLKVNQSRLYLIDRLDEDKKYARFLELLTVSRERTGVRISYNQDVRNGGKPLMPTYVVDRERSLEWKDHVDIFLETAPVGEKLDLNGLSLDEEDIAILTHTLSGLKNILFKITGSSIRIIKITPEQFASLQNDNRTAS